MLYFPIIVCVFSLLFVFFLIRQINKTSPGEGLIIRSFKLIKKGAVTFLKRQFQAIAIISIPLFFIILLIFDFKSGLAFLIGSMASVLSGFIGMTVFPQDSLKAANGNELKKFLDLSFKSSFVAGLSAAGLALLAVSAFYLLTNDLRALIFLGLGASLISVFARTGMSIFVKAASLGQDSAQKTIEDDVENISSCIGVVADLFETYVIALISAMILAGVLFSKDSPLVFLPILLGTIGILASIIGRFLISFAKSQNTAAAMYKGLAVSGLITAVGFYSVIRKITPLISVSVSGNKIYLASLMGLVVMAGIFMITEYFVSKKNKLVKMIAFTSQNSQVGNIVIGLAVAMQATVLPAILIFLGVLVSFWLAGIYGVALAAVAMVSLAGTIISIHAFGVAAEKAGSTAKSIANGYSLVSAGLVSLTIFFIFGQELMASGAKLNFSFDDPRIIASLFLGGLIPYFFSFLIMTRAGKTASLVIPERAKGIDAFIKLALKEMLIFSSILVLTPIAVGLILGPLALAGVLIGSILIGIFLGIFMTLGVAAWSNAKKYIEEGNYGGKDSLAHQTAVIGDTVANSCKDTAGLAASSMIKVISIIALLIVSFLV